MHRGVILPDKLELTNCEISFFQTDSQPATVYIFNYKLLVLIVGRIQMLNKFNSAFSKLFFKEFLVFCIYLSS